MKKNITITGTEKNLTTAIAILTAMGIEVVTEDAKAETTVTKPVKATKKSDGDFDRAKYIDIAKKLGCVGKTGSVYKSCRPVVYKIMNNEIKLAAGKKEVDAIFKANGWTR